MKRWECMWWSSALGHSPLGPAVALVCSSWFLRHFQPAILPLVLDLQPAPILPEVITGQWRLPKSWKLAASATSGGQMLQGHGHQQAPAQQSPSTDGRAELSLWEAQPQTGPVEREGLG